MRRILALSLAVFIAAAASAKAAISYEYVTDVVSTQGNGSTGVIAPSGGTVLAAQGSTVTVNIYLQETLTAGSTSLLASDSGLGTFAVLLTKTGGTGATMINGGSIPVTSPVSTSSANITVNPAFNYVTPGAYLPSSNLTSQNYNGYTTPGSQGQLPNSSGLILLLSTKLTAGTGSTTFQIQDEAGFPYGPGGTVTNGAAGYDIDSTNNASGNGTTTGGATYTGAATPAGGFYTFTVVSVPEPSSVILTGLVASAFGIGVWMRRRRTVAASEGA